MDRLASSPPRRLLLPLFGLAALGLLWLAVRPASRFPPGELSVTQAVCLSAIDPASPDAILQHQAVFDESESSQPESFPPQNSARSSSPLHQRTGAALTTAAFPSGVHQHPLEPDTAADAPSPQSTAPKPCPPSLQPAEPRRFLPIPQHQSKPISQSSPQLQAAVSAASDPPHEHSQARQGSENTDDPRRLQQTAASQRLPPPLNPSIRRSHQLESIAQQADRHTRRGFQLAGRRAYFAARSEFVVALHLLAQGLDSEHQTGAHGRALIAGLTAIRETKDFISRGSRLEADLNVAEIVGAHSTPVLKEAGTELLTPLEALTCYFTYAQEQLSKTVANEVAGSMALHGLGKVHAALAMQNSFRVPAAESKAMTFYQAALLVHLENYMASNDLGVLMARCGHFPEARMALQHSLSIYPQSAGWHNLAIVHHRLGQKELAQQARHEARRVEAAARQARRQLAYLVDWVDAKTFAQSYAKTVPPAQYSPLRPTVIQPPSHQNKPALAKSLVQWPLRDLLQQRKSRAP